MKIYTLKSIAQRGTMLGAAFALAVSTVTPFAPSALADDLNPLTDRSLTLSSSSPGWDYLDGSGNSTYAPPNSGANGNKVGNTFDFRVSTDSTAATGTGDGIKTMTFQYCTTPAGNCTAPGNNAYSGTGPYTRNANGPSEYSQRRSDLDVTISSPTQAPLATYVTDTDASSSGNVDGVVSSVPAPGTAGNNFLVYYVDDNDTPGDDSDDVWTASTGWTMTRANQETGDPSTGSAGTPPATGKFNQIVLTNSGTQELKSGTRVKVVFFATDANYITNPGAGAFFVRINTLDTSSGVIDGGVTVANVMNQGIQIVTKVLETMDFSVGVVDPYLLEAAADDGQPGGPDETSQLYTATGNRLHRVCEPVLTKMDRNADESTNNRLQMGNENGEFSLATDRTYSTHSYFRLSSNSSAGATVYYSGNTLTNTVGDRINAAGDPGDTGVSDGNAHYPTLGAEQFGIALDHGTSGPYAVNYNVERSSTPDPHVYETGADNAALGLAAAYGSAGLHSSVKDVAISNVEANASWHDPQLFPLVPKAAYANGAGVINNVTPYGGTVNTQFAFQPTSMSIPVALASNDDQVVDCITGKVNYIANIASTTPAGIYTTKINYIAAPQY